jgi:hypothetical protein
MGIQNETSIGVVFLKAPTKGLTLALFRALTPLEFYGLLGSHQDRANEINRPYSKVQKFPVF